MLIEKRRLCQKVSQKAIAGGGSFNTGGEAGTQREKQWDTWVV